METNRSCLQVIIINVVTNLHSELTHRIESDKMTCFPNQKQSHQELMITVMDMVTLS